MNGTKVYVTSKACSIVQIETNHIAAYLKENGYRLVDSINEADAIMITTCAVTEKSAEATYRGIMECLKERRDGVPVYVIGCYTRIEKEEMRELSKHENIIPVPEVKDIQHEFVGTSSWDSIIYNNFFSHPFADQTFKEAAGTARTKGKVLNRMFSLLDSVFRKDMSFHYFIRNGHLYSPEIQRRIWPVIVSKGCTHACAYCAVRIGRGKYASKRPSSVLTEVRTGIEKGYKKTLLIGDELGPYGIDLKDGTSFSSLLGLLSSDELPISIGLWYLDCFHLMEVRSIIEELCEKGKISFLGITVQSGSARILKLMNRRYSLEDSLDAIRSFRKYPGIIIATQIMVGFPTETDEDFQQSVDVIDRGYFDLVEVFEYSPRPGTRAAKMIDDIPPHVKKDRAMILRDLAGKKGRKLFLRHIGNEFKK